ncbi:MAG: sulfatase-like hydrolase/transferase [Phycisphaeraceae bacterium]|nr:sulfatase-like hydrolase/transferase [Phycisphaeraceae bacterium]
MPPNILFILSDQQRWDTVGCYGSSPMPYSLTPNLDALAAQGVRFKHAFTCQPVCGPSRSCLQSGVYATQSGCYTNHRALPENQLTIAKLLSSGGISGNGGAAGGGATSGGGYETAYVGKWHLASDRQNKLMTQATPPARRGGYRDYWMAADTLEMTSHGYEGYFFDTAGRRVDWEGYRVDRTTDFALEYLRDYARRAGGIRAGLCEAGPATQSPALTDHATFDARQPTADRPARPFFLFLSYIEPHHQNDLDRYVGPIGSKDRFRGFTPPPDLAQAQQTYPPAKPGAEAAQLPGEGFALPGAGALPGAIPGGDWREHYPDYLGCCASIDENVGRLRAELQQLGLWDNTLVIYTSDHGCHFKTRNHEYKRSCHDASIRVPLVIHGPGFRGGAAVEELVSLIDLPATVVAAAGLPVPPAFRGRPLQELAAGEGVDWPQEVFIQISETQIGRAIRTPRWKYGVIAPQDKDTWNDPGSDRYVEAYLYDLKNDPHELHNLVADPTLAAGRAELANILKRRMADAGEALPYIDPAENL